MNIVSENSNLPPDFAILNKSAARTLNLPGSRYLVYSVDQDELLIGPVVGIMTTAIRNNHGPSGKTGRLFKELIDYSSRKGIFVYLFSPDGISRDHYYIRGITISHNSWKPGRFAWPDIIYNRIRFRKIEKQQAISRLLYELNKDPRVYIFNSRFLNKKEVHEALKNQPQVKNMIPDTEVFSRQNLQGMLQRYSEVFIKPNHGSIGRGIFKVRWISPRRYSFAGVSSSATVWKGPYTFDLLFRHLSIEVSRKNYLIQQAVDLSRYNSRLFDVRSQVQKDQHGEWILTGAAVRVAGKGRFVTHIPNGGRAEVFDDVVTRVFPSIRTRQEINKQLEDISTLVPLILEKELGINLGILTMDLGIDINGKIWILEVNSKPSSFDEDDIRTKHLQNLTDYFVYAARNKNRKG
ncbi:hypothetical protein ASZ90_018171 [hydrocarbon metagenome]|uniref:ATP-grasp domain-containing protein n=1 Tax=hydrocarbon metagenome TaxID=938273 RepID=A0A0W8E709_9ZZZZ